MYVQGLARHGKQQTILQGKRVFGFSLPWDRDRSLYTISLVSTKEESGTGKFRQSFARSPFARSGRWPCLEACVGFFPYFPIAAVPLLFVRPHFPPPLRHLAWPKSWAGEKKGGGEGVPAVASKCRKKHFFGVFPLSNANTIPPAFPVRVFAPCDVPKTAVQIKFGWTFCSLGEDSYSLPEGSSAKMPKLRSKITTDRLTPSLLTAVSCFMLSSSDHIWNGCLGHTKISWHRVLSRT